MTNIHMAVENARIAYIGRTYTVNGNTHRCTDIVTFRATGPMMVVSADNGYDNIETVTWVDMIHVNGNGDPIPSLFVELYGYAMWIESGWVMCAYALTSGGYDWDSITSIEDFADMTDADIYTIMNACNHYVYPRGVELYAN